MPLLLRDRPSSLMELREELIFIGRYAALFRSWASLNRKSAT
jgi:hypothetical protein